MRTTTSIERGSSRPGAGSSASPGAGRRALLASVLVGGIAFAPLIDGASAAASPGGAGG